MKDGRGFSFVNTIEDVINSKNPNLILCVIPSARGDIYSLIKRKLCIDRAGKNFKFFFFFYICYLFYHCPSIYK
jgi:hypothetical protein